MLVLQHEDRRIYCSIHWFSFQLCSIISNFHAENGSWSVYNSLYVIFYIIINISKELLTDSLNLIISVVFFLLAISWFYGFIAVSESFANNISKKNDPIGIPIFFLNFFSLLLFNWYEKKIILFLLERYPLHAAKFSPVDLHSWHVWSFHFNYNYREYIYGYREWSRIRWYRIYFVTSPNWISNVDDFRDHFWFVYELKINGTLFKLITKFEFFFIFRDWMLCEVDSIADL